MDWQREEVKQCSDLCCPLWMYRPFKKEDEDDSA